MLRELFLEASSALLAASVLFVKYQHAPTSCLNVHYKRYRALAKNFMHCLHLCYDFHSVVLKVRAEVVQTCEEV